MSKLRSALALAAIVAVAAACSAFDPQVGALRGDASAPSCGVGASGYGTMYGSPSGAAAAFVFCTPDGGTLGGACDECEAHSCCSQRVGCYTDEGCSCADKALDTCLGSIPTPGVPDASDADAGDDAGGGADAAAANAAAQACWATFGKQSALAQARLACVTASCAAACLTP